MSSRDSSPPFPSAEGHGEQGTDPDELDDGPDELDADELDGGVPSVASSPAGASRLKSLVVEHHAFVWRSLVRLGVPRADAEDAAQQVMMVLAKRLDDINPGAERAFMYGVALRVASRTRRTHARRREVMNDETIPERVDESLRPDELMDRARARALLDEILESMPLELRSTFTLFELEQMTMAQIAELLDIPPGTVASRLRRARELFVEQRKRLEAKIRFAQASSHHSAKETP